MVTSSVRGLRPSPVAIIAALALCSSLAVGCAGAADTGPTSAAQEVANLDEAPQAQLEALATGGSTTVYDDQLENGYADWSWATHSLSQSAVVHTGKAAISLQANAYQGLMLATSTPWTVSQYAALDFWIYGSGSGGQQLLASLYFADGTGSTQVNLGSYVAGGSLPAAKWSHVTVPLTAMAPKGGSASAFVLQGAVSGTQATVYVDDVTLTAAASSTPTPTPTAKTVVYADALQNGYADWSWATHSLTQTAIVHSGTAAISMGTDGYKGLMFASSAAWAPSQYSALDFWIYGSGAGGQQLLASLYYADGSGSVQVALDSYASGGKVAANAWTHVTVPISAMATRQTNVTAVTLQSATSASQGTVYVDDVALLQANSSSGGSTSVTPVAWPNIVFGDNPGGNDPTAVALTFDDGPDGSGGTGQNNTGYVLDQLKKLGLHATFFTCGNLVSDLVNDPVAQADMRRIINEGHDLGNHTYDHQSLEKITAQQVDSELAMNLAVVQNANVLGASASMSMYRAPFGQPFQVDDPNVAAVGAITHKYGVHVGWGIDADDWKCAQDNQSVDCIINNVKYQLNQGRSGVILMHAIYKLTGDALPAVVQAIYDRGYHIVMVQDFIKAKYGVSSDALMKANRGASFSKSQLGQAAQNACGLNDFDIDPPY